MLFETGIRLLRMLPASPEKALTAAKIFEQWPSQGEEGVSQRSIERYMLSLMSGGSWGNGVVGATQEGRSRAYFLLPEQVATWFVTEEAALGMRLTHQVLGRTFGNSSRTNSDTLADMAERVLAASPSAQRVQRRLRIAPDGLGRLPARIDRNVLRTVIDAIARDRKLHFSYADSAGHESKPLASPLGLVAKDGTIYLVAAKGLSDRPRSFALHRVASAEVHFQVAQARPDFDLDEHIEASHQFSHRLDAEPPIALKLRVAPGTIYHFRERPLSRDQSIRAPRSEGGWYSVTATVPQTVLLIPFLAGMGPWIEVMEPQALRSKTAEWLRDSAALYANVE
jgi:predicted DNA-binding transcriptional regulator YafY